MKTPRSEIDLDRIHFVTRHFNDLQGLRYWVPLGLITLGCGVVFASASLPLAAVLFVGAFLLIFGARRYYSRTFGEVETQTVRSAQLYPVSIFNPAGAIPRLHGFSQVTPGVQPFLNLQLVRALGSAAPGEEESSS